MAGYRPPYTLKEDNKILRYIIENEGYFRLRGRAFWQEMEACFERRTWQSLKEHFKNKIQPVILTDKRLEISSEERKKIKRGWQTSALNSDKREDVRRRFSNLEDMSSDDEQGIIEKCEMSNQRKQVRNVSQSPQLECSQTVEPSGINNDNTLILERTLNGRDLHDTDECVIVENNECIVIDS